MIEESIRVAEISNHQLVQDTPMNLKASRRVEFLGCPIDLITKSDLIDELWEAIEHRNRKCVIHFVNGNKIAQASNDEEMRRILWRGDYVLTDGQPLVPMARMLGIRIPERIDGIGLMESLLQLANQHGLRIYLLGAKQEVVEKCVKQIQEQHSRLIVAGFRNGYFKPGHFAQIVGEINSTRPDILFIGIGTPLKERLADEWGGRLHAPVIQGVGGSFDV
ncbi:MAG: WecB/TagA/CpsF family glycosyltransferase, partial [Limisphaerales bacterium]